MMRLVDGALAGLAEYSTAVTQVSTAQRRQAQATLSADLLKLDSRQKSEVCARLWVWTPWRESRTWM